MFVNCLFWGISHSYNCTNITTQASIFDCTTGQTARLAEKCCARARPSIAGPGYRGCWVRPSVAGAAVYRGPGLRPSRALGAAVHRGRGLLHCGRGLRMLALHQATWPVRLSALVFAWWTLCNGCNYLGRSGFGSVFRAVARTKKTRCKARDASIAGAHCSCHEQCCARARPSFASLGCAHRGRGLQPSIAGAGGSIASAVYSCPEQC
jgi:hypothetical protein